MSQDQYIIYVSSKSLGAGFFEVTDPNNTLTALEVQAVSGTGMVGKSGNGIGVSGITDVADSANATGVFGKCTVPGNAGFAGQFVGKVDVQGTVTKSLSQFCIDCPLDSENKWLSHAAVESSEMKNIYDGSVILDARGEAVIELPDWFEALNKDFRYQLTCVGDYAPVYIAEKLQNKHFKVAGGHAQMEVCWQVTGIRHDAYANAHPLVVVEEKSAAERGYYRHPELHGQPEEKGIEWARHAEHMRQIQPMVNRS